MYVNIAHNKLVLHLWKAVSLTKWKQKRRQKTKTYFAVGFWGIIILLSSITSYSNLGFALWQLSLIHSLERNKIKKYANWKKKCSGCFHFCFFRFIFIFSSFFQFLRCLFISPMPLHLYLLVPWSVFHEPDVYEQPLHLCDKVRFRKWMVLIDPAWDYSLISSEHQQEISQLIPYQMS